MSEYLKYTLAIVKKRNQDKRGDTDDQTRTIWTIVVWSV